MKIIKRYFLNLNYAISKVLLAEFKNASYFVNSQNYTFSNLVLNYNPSRFSYRVVFNNILNEDKFTFVTLNNFTFLSIKCWLGTTLSTWNCKI
jgi:hypothetical protein